VIDLYGEMEMAGDAGELDEAGELDASEGERGSMSYDRSVASRWCPKMHVESVVSRCDRSVWRDGDGSGGCWNDYHSYYHMEFLNSTHSFYSSKRDELKMKG